jgi:hypothetical protein
MANCKRCNKKISFFQVHNTRHYGLCRECCDTIDKAQVNSPNFEEWKAKNVHYLNPDALCNKCGYFEEIRHDRGGVDSLGTFFDESYLTFKCRKFSLNLDKDNFSNAKQCTSYISKYDYEEKCLKGEINSGNIQVVLDFSSLKDIMSKGGLIMSSYKCPNCSGMVDLPEAGKVLICKYCGSPIKPVDIFEKIKSLIQ